MLLSTTAFIGQKQILETKNLVYSDVVVGANVVKDVLASITDFVGGRSSSYEEIFEKARKHVIREMIVSAKSVGANAIVGISFQTNSLGQNNTILQMSASGTAVVISDKPPIENKKKQGEMDDAVTPPVKNTKREFSPPPPHAKEQKDTELEDFSKFFPPPIKNN